MTPNQPIGRGSLAKPLRRIQRDQSDRRSQRGGSLIEVLVTMVILMVVLFTTGGKYIFFAGRYVVNAVVSTVLPPLAPSPSTP